MSAPDIRPRVSLTRRITFHLSWTAEDRTAPVYSRGPKYLCEFTISGPIDDATGMVMNITDLKAILAEVSDRCGRLNDPFTRELTCEEMARFTWVQVSRMLPRAVRAERVRIWEDPTFAVEIQRKEHAMVDVIRRYDFSAAHRLHSPHLSDQENAGVFGKCNNEHGHGHNYGLDVTLRGEPDRATGMAVDLEAVDSAIERLVLSRFDHKHLNFDLPEFHNVNPTSENVALVIWQLLRPALGSALVRIGLRETDRNYFEVTGDE